MGKGYPDAQEAVGAAGMQVKSTKFRALHLPAGLLAKTFRDRTDPGSLHSLLPDAEASKCAIHPK